MYKYCTCNLFVQNLMRLFSHYLAVNELFTLEVAAESGARRAIGLRVLSRHYRVGQVSARCQNRCHFHFHFHFGPLNSRRS